MPSALNPNDVVQPGPGRLPADTVPAGALLVPPGGGSEAALQAHITDPVDAHMASAIGQTGYAGETWSIVANGTQSALTTLFDSANARPIWVLDANPANKGDFVGANALINAVAAISTNHPILFLRPGTYNWNDAVDFTDCVIIASGRNLAEINCATLRTGFNSHFENIVLTLSGNLTVNGDEGTLQNVKLTVSGLVNVTGARNVFSRIQVDIAQKFVITGESNTITEYVNCAFDLSSTAHKTVIRHGFNTTVRSATDPIVKVASNYNSISDIYVSGLASYNAICFSFLTAKYNTCRNLALDTFTTPGASFQAYSENVGSGFNETYGLHIRAIGGTVAATMINLQGTNSIVTDVEFTAFSATVNATLISVGGNYNTIESVSGNNIGFAGAAFRGLYMLGLGNIANQIYFRVGSSLAATNTVIEFDTTSKGNEVHGLTLDSMFVGVGKLLMLTGTDNVVQDFFNPGANVSVGAGAHTTVSGTGCRLSQVFIDNVTGNGTLNALVNLSGSAMMIDGITFTNVGPVTNILIPLVRITSGGGTVQNILADGASTPIRASQLIDYVNVTEVMTICNCRGDMATGNGTTSCFNSSGGTGHVLVESCKFIGRGSGAATAALYVENTTGLIFRNCIAISQQGHSCGIVNSGITLEDCEFSDQNTLIGNGVQLFYGWGNTTGGYDSPLIIRNCRIAYSASNCSPISGSSTGQPIVFFGGSGTAVNFNHGTVLVDGLRIEPDSTVTAQHLDSLLVIDASTNGFNKHASSYRNITIDLKEIPWSRSGVGRDTLTWTGNNNAAVIEVQGSGQLVGDNITFELFSADPSTLSNIKIVNLVEPTSGFDDARAIIKALGVMIEGLIIDGPASGLHGINFYTGTSIFLDQAWVRHLHVFPTNLLHLSFPVSVPFISVGSKSVLQDFVINWSATGFHIISTDSVLGVVGDYARIRNGFAMLTNTVGLGTNLGTALINVTGNYNSINDVRTFSLVDVPQILVTGTENDVSNNKVTVDFAGLVQMIQVTTIPSGSTKIARNVLENVHTAGSGGGVLLQCSHTFGHSVLIDGNTLIARSSIAAPIGIIVSGPNSRVANNVIDNTHPTAGWASIDSTGSNNIINGNQILGTTAAANITIELHNFNQTTIVTSNQITNLGAGVGVVNGVGGTDIVANNGLT